LEKSFASFEAAVIITTAFVFVKHVIPPCLASMTEYEAAESIAGQITQKLMHKKIG